MSRNKTLIVALLSVKITVPHFPTPCPDQFVGYPSRIICKHQFWRVECEDSFQPRHPLYLQKVMRKRDKSAGLNVNQNLKCIISYVVVWQKTCFRVNTFKTLIKWAHGLTLYFVEKKEHLNLLLFGGKVTLTMFYKQI